MQDNEIVETDDDMQKNKKETRKLIFSPERFLMTKMHALPNIGDLTNSTKIANFVG